MNVGRVFLTELPRRWDDDSKSFVIQGKYSMFTTEEVSIVMGLYANGMKVNVELKRRKSEAPFQEVLRAQGGPHL